MIIKTSFGIREQQEDEDDKLIQPLLQHLSGGRYLSTKGFTGSLSKTFQLDMQLGDYFIVLNGKYCCLEVKHDRVIGRTNNMFVETWSNKSIGRPGWIRNSNATHLLYHDVTRHRAHILRMGSLQSLCTDEFLCGYRERPQGGVPQDNDTFGRLVPISDIHKRLATAIYDISGEPMHIETTKAREVPA